MATNDPNIKTHIDTVGTQGGALYDAFGLAVAKAAGGRLEFDDLVDVVQDAKVSFVRQAGLVATSQVRNTGTTLTYVATANNYTMLAGNLAVDAKLADVSLGAADKLGQSIKYQVSVPSDKVSGASDPSLQRISPYDPKSMPTGTVIQFNKTDYQQYFGTVGVLGASTSMQVSRADATGYSVKKLDGNKIEVIAGPASVLNVTNKIGGAAGIVTAEASRRDAIDGAALTKAVFDLSARQGQAAYQAFLVTGAMPTKDDPKLGITGVRNIGLIIASSVAKVEIGVDPLPGLVDIDPLKIALRSNQGKLVTVQNPNTGTTDWSLRKQYDNGAELTTTRRFDASGKEDAAARQYTFEFKLGSKQAVDLMESLSFKSLKNQGLRVDAGKDDVVRLTFTEAGMQEMLQLAQRGDDNAKRLNLGIAPATGNMALGAPGKNPLLFADYLAKSGVLGGNANIPDFLEQLAKIADRAAARAPGTLDNGTYAPLPGAIQLQPAAPEQPKQGGAVR